MRLRDGAIDFFNILADREIPLLILSAGIGNVISKFLNLRALLTSNVTVTANKLIFDAHGIVAGFCEPVIHSFNKARHASTPQGYVLLLGDTIEDAQMVNDADATHVIRMGFLNEAVRRKQCCISTRLRYCNLQRRIYGTRNRITRISRLT